MYNILQIFIKSKKNKNKKFTYPKTVYKFKRKQKRFEGDINFNVLQLKKYIKYNK